MPVPLLDFSAQHRAIREEVVAAIARVVDSGGFILGKPVADFEASLAAYCGARWAAPRAPMR
jgi:dTDP-4-amino-4,6-dideoxygalactose transaminase